MTVDKEQTIATIYRAFNARDIEGVLNHLTPDVDWPNGMTGGRERGRAAVKSYWEKQWQEIDPRVEPLRIDITPDGKAHVRVHQFVTAKDGAVLEDKKIEHVYSFDGPFVSRMDIVDRDPHPEDDEDGDDE